MAEHLKPTPPSENLPEPLGTDMEAFDEVLEGEVVEPTEVGFYDPRPALEEPIIDAELVDDQAVGFHDLRDGNTAQFQRHVASPGLVSNGRTGDIIAEIDQADRIFDRHVRTKTLSAIALKYAGVVVNDAGDYEGRTTIAAGADAGVEAAQRLLKSKTRSTANLRNLYLRRKKDHDWVLTKMATEHNNYDAADAIHSKRKRNKALLGVAEKAFSQGNTIKVSHIQNEMNGLSGENFVSQSIAYSAVEGNNPDLLNQLRLIRDVRKRDTAYEELAVKWAASGRRREAFTLVDQIVNPDYKARALNKIANQSA